MKYRIVSRQYWGATYVRVIEAGVSVDIGIATEVLARLRINNACCGVRADYWLVPA